VFLLNDEGIFELPISKGCPTEESIESRMKYGPKLQKRQELWNWRKDQSGMKRLGFSSSLCNGPKIPRVP